MAPANLVLLNRRFEDPATPTASSYSVRNNTSTASHDRGEANEVPSHGFTDYDEGDILDELLQETPRTSTLPSRIATVAALSTEALRSRVSPASSAPSSPIHIAVDDNASTCSSTNAGEDIFDKDGHDHDHDHDDTASMTSMSVSGRSVSTSSGSSSCIAPSSTASPKLSPAAVSHTVGTSGRRRRRRNNRGGNGGVAASDAGFESASMADMERAKSQPRQCASSATTTAPSESSKLPATKQARRERTKKSKSAVVTAARQSRHPRLQIGLDLDVELQLKSKVRGDICLTLVLEETQKVAPRASPEIRRDAEGNYVAYDDWEDVEVENKNEDRKYAKQGDINGIDMEREEIEVTGVTRTKKGSKVQSPQPRPGAPGTERREICHLRVGRLNLTRRWWMDGYEMISRIPPPIVAGVAVTMPIAGFAAGYAAAQWAGLW
ncbi:U1 snRNP protein [Sporothrix stenoceras]|uniref:U1 snRNP protein n=1 Tax=Sporothrix stenoceras TaxID=5173 RepID=A0ABR3YYD6_9PEZI